MTGVVALSPENEAAYESLISLIENSQGRLAPIIVACDDLALRQRVIGRYEMEARSAKIQPYRFELGQEPSVRAGLAKLKESERYLQKGGEAVFTVTGAEILLRVKMNPADAQSELDKFFGYLQWTREGLREFPYPIVLWVSRRILREMSHRAPDFWSWRKAVVRFTDGELDSIERRDWDRSVPAFKQQDEDNFLPPLEELLEEIQALEKKSLESLNLATLYAKLGQVYANRIGQGGAKDLQEEREKAITAFDRATDLQTKFAEKSLLAKTFRDLGNFLYGQSQFAEAADSYAKSLEIAQAIGDKPAETNALNGLGNAYYSFSQYQRAIDFYQQALEIGREISNRCGEADSLGNLGNAYYSFGQYQRAIDFYQQALEIGREIGNRCGEAGSLGNLGSAYYSLRQYKRAIDFHQQALDIKREVGDRHGEANSLIGLGNACESLGQYQQAIDFHQQALDIKREVGDRHGEAGSLIGLGNAYHSFGQYHRAIDFYQKSLNINREIGNRNGEAYSLIGLGNAYCLLGQYQRAINFYQKSLDINREIGDRNGEAGSLLNLGCALTKYESHRLEALQSFQEAKTIFAGLRLDHQVEKCDRAIYHFNELIATQNRDAFSAPQIGKSDISL
jgi:tetratricopeptide (TPR) repeat protein